MRFFPFGSAALAMLLLSLGTGAYLARSPRQEQTATLTYWVFNKSTRDTVRQTLDEFEARHPGVTVEVQLVSLQGLVPRLQAAFQADLDVPDLVAVEISSAGAFFRGPLESIGFIDLTDRIRAEGLDEEIVAARFAPYMSRGRIFGLPLDVHPVMLAYRRDLFEELGIDADAIETWDDFIEVGRRVTIPNRRYLIEMSDAGRDMLEVCLFQRGGGYFDAAGEVIFDDEVGVETLKWYVPLVAAGSKTRIASSLSSSYGQIITKAMEDGYFLSLVAPDWRSKFVENDMPRLSGKMALMPLPAVEPGGRRTSTWGGTMFGITKKCKNPDLAWELVKFLSLNEEDMARRFDDTNCLPPVQGAWDLPAFDRPSAYWSGQPLGRLYADLAPDVPPQYTSPYVGLAKSKLTEALVACVARYNSHGEAGFDAFVRERLKQSADGVRRMMERNPY